MKMKFEIKLAEYDGLDFKDYRCEKCGTDNDGREWKLVFEMTERTKKFEDIEEKVWNLYNGSPTDVFNEKHQEMLDEAGLPYDIEFSNLCDWSNPVEFYCEGDRINEVKILDTHNGEKFDIEIDTGDFNKYKIVKLSGQFDYKRERKQIEQFCCLNFDDIYMEEFEELKFDSFEEAYKEIQKKEYLPSTNYYSGAVPVIVVEEYVIENYYELGGEYIDGADYDCFWEYHWNEKMGGIEIGNEKINKIYTLDDIKKPVYIKKCLEDYRIEYIRGDDFWFAAYVPYTDDEYCQYCGQVFDDDFFYNIDDDYDYEYKYIEKHIAECEEQGFQKYTDEEMLDIVNSSGGIYFCWD